MKAAVFAYTRRGCALAQRLLTILPEAEGYTLERFALPGFRPLGSPEAEFYGGLFRERDALIFVGAAGIAVRSIAPFVRDKQTDPAVLCIDEGGRFMISLLSGHIGGANALAVELASAIGAEPVITTATDVNGRFSVDRWAKEHGCAIGDMAAAKAVSAAILEREIPFTTPMPVAGPLPPGLIWGEAGEIGVYIGYDAAAPFARTLRLIPRMLRLGLGCRRGTEAAALRGAVEAVFAQNGLDLRGVKGAYSIDLKAGEPGLLEYCEQMGWPLVCYTPEQLRAVPGEFFASSPLVERVTGVDNVCERAAMLGAARLVVPKTAFQGVTVAVAAENWEVRFGETHEQ